jgi:3-deoxy-D-manno-octulosonic-acid transferase
MKADHRAREAPATGRWDFLTHCVYDVVGLLAVLVMLPLLLYRMVMDPRARVGLAQRFGFTPRRTGDAPCLWIHGVSVGEILGAERFIRDFSRRYPEWEIALSTTTGTGHEVAKERYPGRLVFFYPLDLSFAVRRVLRRIRPSAVLLVELEIWPNFLLAASRHRIPVGLINGRISERSFRGYRFWKRFLPNPLDCVDAYCVQNDLYADRLRRLGVPPDRIHVTGTMKFDTVALQGDPAQEEILRRELGLQGQGKELVLIGGSTHPPEERILYDCYRALVVRHPGLRLLLAPRHPQRLTEIEEDLSSAGATVVRRTQIDPRRPAPVGPVPPVILIDTMGELGRLYGLADVVFVGGSLIPHGGQNMMEPAGLGKPVLLGPHTFNFADSVELLLEEDALRVVQSADELTSALEDLLLDGEGRAAMGFRARAVIEKNKGASRRNLDVVGAHMIERQLGSRGSCTEARIVEIPSRSVADG